MTFSQKVAISDSRVWGVILAAGSGARLARSCGGQAKQFLNWRGKPLYWHSIETFARCACVEGVVLVLPPNSKENVPELYQKYQPGIQLKVTEGGPTRNDSSILGLARVPLTVRKVLIHDAARPFFTPELIWRICEQLTSERPCVIPGMPVKDTIKLINSAGLNDNASPVEKTLPRANLRSVQTPQGFMASVLRKAQQDWQHLINNNTLENMPEITDDASLMENFGYPVYIINGEEKNCKITTPEDLKLLQEPNSCIPVSGFGYDVHKISHMEEDKPLMLGGIKIPSKFSLIAHSDGDVLLHALMDAILGAANSGDIGQHFPDNNPEFANISSSLLLNRVMTMVSKNNVTITSIDLTLVCQKPKISPFRKEIEKNIGRLTKVDRVNLKATTEEGLGFTGREEGIKAYAIVSGLKRV